MPLKHAVAMNPEVLPETTPPETEIEYVDISTLETGSVEALSPKPLTFGEAPSRARRVLRSGDTILSTVRTYLRAVATFPRVEGNLVASTGFAVLRPNGTLLPRFAYWAALSEPFVNAIVAHSEGVSYPAISPSVLGALHLPVPPVHEQEHIANFLDEQTARIDALIAEKEALLERLDELRLSTIYAYLTSGLDGAKCRRTNDEWFPAVPSHWSFCALNYRYEVQLGKMLDEKRQAGVHSTPYLRNVDVRWDHVNANDLPLIDVAPDERERYTVNAGDLLVCEGGVGVGRTALWTGQDGVVAYQKALHRLRPRGRSDIPRYVLYLMRDAVARGRVLGAEKATIPHLTAESFRRWRFPFPSEKEQRRIVEALDGVSKHCDQLGAHCREHIARLREYRSSLISAAVTGQLGVSAYRLPAAEELATT